MTRALVVTGTDTDAGKTVVAAGLTLCLPGAHYWKPVQSGTTPATDTATVRALTGLPADRFLPEAYLLREPASPHLSARLEGVEIDLDRLSLPETDAPLIVEGAGGLMVPLNERALAIDLFARWGRPVILVARTGLGTINHSLLSIEALRARGIPIGGILFSGDPHAENERIIPQLSGIRSLGRLPRLASLDAACLHAAIEAHIDLAAIEALLA
ncbi:ATP-dependent dethiobiotin synthetase BioD [Sphingobium jiangsuense]|uniref:ATP-dependent dethiobiotin synthetase BioD n=1 Tax=Sphingobium jiangsuense TaxID=870476 RepID=A0A7W6BJI9_9SPHN|nr:dethiobiotin synthase [Sphingobium jiangsuense]MBB3924712.1 dethiobiotin synthetase [Sphingobium jiangsuense]GLT00437.1 ATP-dependent dethiobiotin synthetase BioD [Sphingobium jiangsuense]